MRASIDAHEYLHPMSIARLLATLNAARAGDEAASAELYRLYVPQLQRVIRFHFRDRRVARLLDSDDVCQSVFGDFFTRLRLGQYDIESQEQLAGLLAKIGRNKLIHAIDRHTAARRDVATTIDDDVSQMPLASQDTTPSERASREELIREFRKRLSPPELLIADRRAAGASWNELAKETNEAPDTLRMRFVRTIDRIAGELGL